jgi:hypothetical protein
MVDDIHSAFDYPYEDARCLINGMPREAKIDLFGGEPTLYPYFFEILSDIYRMGCHGSVASNGRRFADPNFTRRTAEVSHGELYVRTTLHGHTAKMHDSITRVPGSFDEFTIGLYNIMSAGMSNQVNIVITKDNLPHLNTMTEMLIDWGVRRIKFGVMLCSENCIGITPSLFEIRPKITKAIQKAKRHGLGVIVEKAPLCLLPEWIHEFSSERKISPWPRSFDEKKCGSCIVRPWCDGIDPIYARHFGTGELKPITKILQPCVNDLPQNVDKDDIRILKLNLFKIPIDSSDNFYHLERTQKTMFKLINESEKTCSRVAFVPDHLIEPNLGVPDTN